MKSYVIKEACAAYLNGLSTEQKRRLLQAAIAYYARLQKGDPAGMQKAYPTLLRIVREGEATSGVQLLASPDGSYYLALNQLSGTVYQAAMKEKSIQFPSTAKANEWLNQQAGILLTNVQIKTRTRLGLFANHSEAASVQISYRRNLGPTQYKYGIMEEEKTRAFLKERNNNYAKDWEARYPGFECVSLYQTSNSRGSSSSVAFGLGLDYVEHVKYFVTFRHPLRCGHG